MIKMGKPHPDSTSASSFEDALSPSHGADSTYLASHVEQPQADLLKVSLANS